MIPNLPFRPKLPRWMSEIGWRTLAIGGLLGGVLHILATFAAPLVSRGNAYQQLRAVLPLNQMVVLPAPSSSKQILPYLQPDVLYAMCRYELTGGPVSVTAAVSGPGWVLSLHTPGGDNFYVLPGQQLRRREVSFLLVPSGDPAHARRAGPTDTQVASPSTEGLIVVRAAITGLAWVAETEAVLRKSSCTQVKR
ncbi:MAG: DUF1254 domain-containing protein [Hyphomonadaceae bacterium]|nr:DUF1254 domain-containing protein [Hyphomonadaceae bacterium]